MSVKLFVLGLPGSGKSAIARSIKSYLNLQRNEGQIGRQLLVIHLNDYAILDTMFHQDTQRQKFKSAQPGGFDVTDLQAFDEALQTLEQEVNAELASSKVSENKFAIVEFSRNNYRHAFQQFNKSFLTDAYFLYLHAELDICKMRVQQRIANPRFEEDDHPVSDYIFEHYYFGDDEEHLAEILMHEYLVDRRRILIAKNSGSMEEVLADIHRFVDTILEDKIVVHSASRFLSGEGKAK